jgi:bacterioferritin
MSFVKDIEEVRARARRNMERGPVTQDYQLDTKETVNILNEALATEIMCVLRYRFHYVAATGIHSAAVAEEFLENAQQEQEHASRIAQRIKELGGKPEMNPAVVAKTSHTQYIEGETLADMIREDLVAERIVIETYRQMVNYFDRKDPTSRKLMEEILANEEEHADELSDLLFAISPAMDSETRRLYFADEIPNARDGGDSESRTARK